MTAPSGLLGLPTGADDEDGGGVVVGDPEAGVCGGGGGDRVRLTESGATAVGGRGGLGTAGDWEPEPGFWESPDGVAAPVGPETNPGDDVEGTSPEEAPPGWVPGVGDAVPVPGAVLMGVFPAPSGV